MSADATTSVINDLTAALSAWHSAIACVDAAFSHGANEDFEWGEAIGALNAARRLASCADAARAHLADAGKREAVKALRDMEAQVRLGAAQIRPDLAAAGMRAAAAMLKARAAAIESGAVTLP